MLKELLFILCFCFIISCSSENTSFSSSKNFQSKVSLPKPIVVDQKLNRKQTFIQLKQPGNILQIDWAFLFNLNRTLTNSEISSTTLIIHSECFLNSRNNSRKRFSSHTKRRAKRLIPLLSVLPKKILLLKSNDLIVCNFNFNAQNPYGASHRFALKSVTISKKNSEISNIQISKLPKDVYSYSISNNKTALKPAYVIFNSLKNYFIDSNAYSKTANSKYLSIDSFGLHCDHFNRYTQKPVRTNMLVLSQFFKTKELPDIQNHPIQSCRILAYHQNLVVALSSFFNLIFPHDPQINVYSAWDSFNQNYPGSYYEKISKERWKYDYIIKNPHPISIFLKIKPLSFPPKVEIMELFYHSNQSKFRYFKEAIEVSAEIYEKGSFIRELLPSKISNNLILELQPSQYAFIRVAINKSIEFCHPFKHPIRTVHWLGAILKSEQLRIQQVLSDPLSSEILYTAPNTVSNKTLFMFTPPLLSFAKNNIPSSLRFEAFPCSDRNTPNSPSRWLYLVNHKNNTLSFLISPSISAIDSKQVMLRWIWQFPYLQNTLLPNPKPLSIPMHHETSYFNRRSIDYMEP